MTDEKILIYGSHRLRYDAEERKLKSEKISDTNKKLIKKFLNHLISNNTTQQRCRKVSSTLRTICKLLEKDLDTVEKDDIIDVFVKIKSSEKHAEATKQDFILGIKQFYKWFEDEDERIYDANPIKRRKITLMYKYIRQTKTKEYRKKINATDILTDEDIKTVLKYCYTTRDKVIIRLLHETGARAGEFLNLRIKHVLFEDDGRAKIMIPDGKTGPRRVPIVYSVALLREYLDCHPHNVDPNSPLWWTLSSSNHHKPLLHQGASKMIRHVWDRIPKHLTVAHKAHNMHFFRHSRATLLAPTMTESLLCKFMGWRIGSREVKTYVHLSPEDLDQVYYTNMGLEPNKKENKRLPKKCQFCSSVNDVINDYCHKCGRPLDLEVAIKEDIKIEKQKEQTYNLFAEMMQNPEFVEFAKSKGINL